MCVLNLVFHVINVRFFFLLKLITNGLKLWIKKFMNSYVVELKMHAKFPAFEGFEHD